MKTKWLEIVVWNQLKPWVNLIVFFNCNYNNQNITETKDNLFLDFETSMEIDDLLTYFLNLFKSSLEYTQKSILPELIFVNLLRASCELVNVKHSQKVARNKIALLALSQIFYIKTCQIRNNYEN